MKRLILHIGTHKTGTSAFQHALWQQRANLRNIGVVYDWMELDFNKHTKAYEWIGGRNASEESRAMFIDNLESAISQYDTVVVSEEALTEPGGIYAETLAQLRDKASVTILAVFRPQYELLEALWSQHLREGKTRLPIERYIETERRIKQCNYWKILGHWVKHFPDADFKVFAYADIRQRLVATLSEACSIPLKSSGNLVNKTPPADVNRLIEFFVTRNLQCDMDKLYQTGLASVEAENSSVLTSRMRKEIATRYEKENKLLYKEFGVFLPPPDERRFVPPISESEIFALVLDAWRNRKMPIYAKAASKAFELVDRGKRFMQIPSRNKQ